MIDSNENEVYNWDLRCRKHIEKFKTLQLFGVKLRFIGTLSSVVVVLL
jgi:hypothetical protein